MSSTDVRGTVGVQMVTRNTSNDLLKLARVYSTGTEGEKTVLEYDCVVLIAYSWGHTAKERKEYRDAVALPFTERERYAAEEARRRAAIVANTIARPGVGEYAWNMYVQQYAMQLTNQHVWLSETDGDWHRPLIVFMRHEKDKNRRVRSAKAIARRSQRRFYGSSATAETDNPNSQRTATVDPASSSSQGTATAGQQTPQGDDSQGWSQNQSWSRGWQDWWSSGWRR
jgi:hypothetical protein